MSEFNASDAVEEIGVILVDFFNSTDEQVSAADTARVFVLFDQLDTHLTNGGALPRQWADVRE